MEIDLSGILTPAALSKLKKHEAKAKTKAKGRGQHKPQQQLPRNLAPVSSPWEAVAAVLVETVITCKCGAVWTTPASDTPLVRFIHKRNGTVWEVANHPALMRPGLPKEIRTLDGSCEACYKCWDSDDDEDGDGFFLTYDLDSDHRH